MQQRPRALSQEDCLGSPPRKCGVFSILTAAVHGCPSYRRSAWIMRDGTKRIPGNIPGLVCNTACHTGASERAADVTPHAHSASCERECAWESECNC